MRKLTAKEIARRHNLKLALLRTADNARGRGVEVCHYMTNPFYIATKLATAKNWYR